MRRAIIVAVLVLGAARPGGAQSLFATRGLGVPIAPVDARARALGGIGIGLLGPNASIGNPAEAAGILFRGGSVAIQPSTRTVEVGGESDGLSATRFPLIRAFHPLGGRTIVSLGWGSFLDQSWGISQRGQEVLGTDTLNTEDEVRSIGGIAQVRLGVAYQVLPSLAAGVDIGLYTGDLRRDVTRTFPDEADELVVFRDRTRFSYAAPLASLGLRWDPRPLLRVGAAVTWSGELDVRVEEGGAAGRAFDLPLQVAAGASGVLASRLTGALAFRWSGWGVANDDFGSTPGAAEAAADALEVGAGIEWGGAQAGARAFPVRLGFSRVQLPFRVDGSSATEWALALGVGARLAPTDAGPLAVADLSLERGGRSGGDALDLTEDFWRFTLSLALFGR